MELVHFTNLFPHPRLTLELVLVDMEEDRMPKVKHRFRRKNYESLEQTLVALNETVQLRKSSDLWKILPKVRLPKTFDTAELGRQIERHAGSRKKWLTACAIAGNRSGGQARQQSTLSPHRSRRLMRFH